MIRVAPHACRVPAAEQQQAAFVSSVNFGGAARGWTSFRDGIAEEMECLAWKEIKS